jgi:ComF family protein
MVDKLRGRLAAVLWPACCVLCRGPGSAGRDLCAACERDLRINAFCCRVCAQPLLRDRAGAGVCGRCLSKPSTIATSFVPFRYGYPLDRMIQRLKYGGDLTIARVLGELFAEHRARAGDTLPEVIIPVPLGARRYRRRGFNQAFELARYSARRCKIPLRADLVERWRETDEQAGLPRRQRRRNVRGAFRLAQPLPAAHVAIFDDVVTTGSTVNELARLLRRAGATTIEVWAIARAGR